MKPFAIQLKNQLTDGDLFTTIKLTQAGKDLKIVPGCTETLTNRKLSFKQFIHIFPDFLRLTNEMFFPTWFKMEDCTQLAITCKQINMECKEPYIQKLKKAKHAARHANYRLKKQIKKLQITNELLAGLMTIIAKHNEHLSQTTQAYTAKMTEN